MNILAIDPGNVQSAYAVLEDKTLRPLASAIIPNAQLLGLLEGYCSPDDTALVIEMVASYGIAVGETVFETVFWLGRFYEAGEHFAKRDRLKRMNVKMNLCHKANAKDANIRQALIDRFAVYDKKRGTGTKSNPDWFHGFRRDIWQAYAVGVTYHDLSMRGLDNGG